MRVLNVRGHLNMAHTYTPGLAVTPWSVTVKKRILPIPGEVLVSQSQQVASDTVVARAELPGKVHVLNVVNQLGIMPEDLKDFMVKARGRQSRERRGACGE